MISASTLALFCFALAAGFMLYGIYKGAPTSTTAGASARYAAIIAAILFVVGFGLHGYGVYADDTKPAPDNPDVDPDDDPDPPPPAPVDFASQVTAAFKADGGTRTQAVTLGMLSGLMGQLIMTVPDRFNDASVVGQEWEYLRATQFGPLISEFPKTHGLLHAAIKDRNLNIGPITDQNRSAHAQLWLEFGRGLLAYE